MRSWGALPRSALQGPLGDGARACYSDESITVGVSGASLQSGVRLAEDDIRTPHAHKEGKLSSPRSRATIWLFKPKIQDTNLGRLPIVIFLFTELWEIMHNWSSPSNKLPWEMESKPVGTSWSVCSSLREGKTANRDPSKVSKAGWRCKTDGKWAWN